MAGSSRRGSGCESAARLETKLPSRAVERLPLSARGRARVARVSATVAALAGAEDVGPEHLAEALSFRTPNELAVAA